MSNKGTRVMNQESNEKRALVPRLRFPEFQGEWASSPMSRMYSFKGNNSLPRDKLNYEGGLFRNIHYGDIHTKFAPHFRVNSESVPYINDGESHSAIRPENYCAAGDMIFADASEDMADIGKAIEIIETGDVPLVSGLHTILAKLNGIPLALGFGAYLFSSDGVRKQIQREAQGAKVLGLSASRLGNVELHYPSEADEQQKIADCLSSLDELIAAETQKLDTLKVHKKGLMQQLFPREGETVPRLRFPEFRDAAEWEESGLGSLTTKIGSGITPLGGDKNYKTEGRPFIRSQNVGWGELIVNDVAFIDDEMHESFDSTEIKEFDVLLNITGASIGRSAVADSRITGGNVNQHVCIIRTNSGELDPVLLNQFLISDRGQKQIDSFQAGGNRQGLNFAQIRSFSIPLPPTVVEQNRIATCLSSLDALISVQSQEIDTLKAHKKGLMQQLFPVVAEVQA